ncbi:hypothetical protein Tco_0577727 [Tanacetum coccineum]
MDQEDLQQAALDEALVPIKFEIKAELFREILRITPRVPNQEFIEPLPHDDLVSFVKQLDFQFQIDSRQTSAKRREQMPYPRFTKVIINHFLSKHNTLSRRHGSFLHMIKYDSVLGKLKFVSKGEEHQKYGMYIPNSMMNDAIRSSDSHLTYLALSTNTEAIVPKEVKGKSKCGKGKKKAATSVLKKKKKDVVKKNDSTPKKKHSRLTSDDNILPDRDEAIKEVPKKSAKGALDDSEKLKGIEILSEAALYESYMKQAIKSRKQDYKIQQHSIGSSEGAGIIPEVPDKPNDIFGSSSSSSSDDETEIISSDDEKKADDQKKKAEEEKIEEKKADDEQAGVDQAQDDQSRVIIPEIQQEKPKVPPTSSSLTVSSAEYGNQFLNVSSDTSLVGILKDPTTEPEIQSMVAHSSRGPCSQVTSAFEYDLTSKFEQRFSELEKKVEAMSKINQPKAIKESVQANLTNELKNQLPKLLAKALSDFVKPRLESTVHDLKNMLYDKMQQSGSFQEHQKHLDLYNALIGSIVLDEAIAKGEIDPAKVLKKRHRDDKNDDPLAKSDKEKKRRKRKDYKPSKDDQAGSSKKGSTVDFTKFVKNRLKKDKITKADLRVPIFKLLKGTCRNNIKLEYNMEQSRLTAKSPHEVSSRMQILSVIRLTIDNQFGYGYLKEIVVRRADMKEYTFIEGCDGTLKIVRHNLNDMLHNFVLGYNHAMPKRAWTEKDQEQTDELLKMIDNLLLERRIMRSLECYVGGRTNETDYRLRIRTI